MAKKGSYRVNRKNNFRRNLVFFGILIVLCVVAFVYVLVYFNFFQVKMNPGDNYHIYVREKNWLGSTDAVEGASVIIKQEDGTTQEKISGGNGDSVFVETESPARELYVYKEGYVPYVRWGTIPWNGPGANQVIIQKSPLSNNVMLSGVVRYKNCKGNPSNPFLVAPNIPIFISYKLNSELGGNLVYVKMIKSSENGYFKQTVPKIAYVKIEGINEITGAKMEYHITVGDNIATLPPNPRIASEKNDWKIEGIEGTNIIVINDVKDLSAYGPNIYRCSGDYVFI